MSTKAVQVGLFGGSKGADFDITGKTTLAPASLKSLEIWSTSGDDGVINAIKFTFVDDGNHEFTLDPWGSPLPRQRSKTIDMTNLCMTELSGYTDGEYITSLSFVTTGATKDHVPFGKVNPKLGVDTPFRIPLVGATSSIVAFFAKADDCLSAIGAYIKP